MRTCDKCGKKLRKNDGSSHIEFGYGYIYDICAECEQNFLLHVDSFFEKEESNEEYK